MISLNKFLILRSLKVKISKYQTKNVILQVDKLNLESHGTCVLRLGLWLERNEILKINLRHMQMKGLSP